MLTEVDKLQAQYDGGSSVPVGAACFDFSMRTSLQLPSESTAPPGRSGHASFALLLYFCCRLAHCRLLWSHGMDEDLFERYLLLLLHACAQAVSHLTGNMQRSFVSTPCNVYRSFRDVFVKYRLMHGLPVEGNKPQPDSGYVNHGINMLLRQISKLRGLAVHQMQRVHQACKVY